VMPWRGLRGCSVLIRNTGRERRYASGECYDGIGPMRMLEGGRLNGRRRDPQRVEPIPPSTAIRVAALQRNKLWLRKRPGSMQLHLWAGVALVGARRSMRSRHVRVVRVQCHRPPRLGRAIHDPARVLSATRTLEVRIPDAMATRVTGLGTRRAEVFARVQAGILGAAMRGWLLMLLVAGCSSKPSSPPGAMTFVASGPNVRPPGLTLRRTARHPKAVLFVLSFTGQERDGADLVREEVRDGSGGSQRLR
jgi:hypothetical protein